MFAVSGFACAEERAAAAGLTVWLRATCLAREPGARFALNGTLGSFRKFGMDCQEAHLLAGDMFSSKPWGVEGPEHWGTLTLDEGGEPVCSKHSYRGRGLSRVLHQRAGCDSWKCGGGGDSAAGVADDAGIGDGGGEQSEWEDCGL